MLKPGTYRRQISPLVGDPRTYEIGDPRTYEIKDPRTYEIRGTDSTYTINYIDLLN
jgi:hypothetical protein